MLDVKRLSGFIVIFSLSDVGLVVVNVMPSFLGALFAVEQVFDVSLT